VAGGGLQGVDGRELARLHGVARHLAEDMRQRLAGDWRAGLDARGRAAATLAATNLSTRLMEAVNWLLTAQAVAAGEVADPGPAVWRAGPSTVPSKDALAVAVERLYRRIMELDTEAR
jgi:hypothetical protein